MLHELLDETFVQSWHGKQQLVRIGDVGWHTSYSGQARANLRFAWYSHRLSKLANEPCLHREFRHRGMAACRRAGIYTAADLIEFDPVAHWERYLACYWIDFAHLGRTHANKLAGTRRQKPLVSSKGGWTYNVDAASGSLLFRALSAHEQQEMRSVQRFIDEYGRGPFLRRLDLSSLTPSIDYVAESLEVA